MGLGRAAVAGYTSVGPERWSTFVAVLLAVAALVSVVPASADETDDAFIAALENNGISHPAHG